MASSTPTVFVCSATGSQGGSVAKQLLEINWKIHATARDLSAAEARNLASCGAQLTKGDWDNLEALRASISGCDKLFLCLFPNFAEPQAEVRQARNILRIAKDAGVKQVVASTTLGISQLEANLHVEPGSFMEKHLRNKQYIESAVKDLNFDSYTLLRPAFFMANFLEPKNSRYTEVRDHETWTTAMTEDSQLALIDHCDIARFALAAFQDPGRFDGKIMVLASELLTVQETLNQLGEAAGKSGEFKAVYMTDEEIKNAKETNVLTSSASVMRSLAQYVDMKELAATIRLTTFREFLERERNNVKKTFI